MKMRRDAKWKQLINWGWKIEIDDIEDGIYITYSSYIEYDNGGESGEDPLNIYNNRIDEIINELVYISKEI